MKEQYHKQVRLVLQCLPLIAKETIFALKGGTAINLFVRESYHRASVDIDLTYIKVQERNQSLSAIEQGLMAIQDSIVKSIPRVHVIQVKNKAIGIVSKLEVQLEDIAIKIEPNLIFRGSVFSTQVLNISKAVENYYGLTATQVPVVSTADLWAGKICAALDRQHPRDLFDVGHIIDQGMDVNLKNAFLIYLLSNNRPIHELLNPNLLDISNPYRDEFLGMANSDTSIEQLISHRTRLIKLVKQSLNSQDKAFLISVKKGIPDFSLFPINGVEKLPSIQWKLHNIRKMKKQKHSEYLKKLEEVL